MSKLRNRRTNVRRTAVAVTGAAALLALLTACNGTASGSVSADGGSAAPAAGDSTSANGSTGGSGSGSGSGTGSSGSTSGSSASGGSSATGGSSGASSSSGGSSSGGSSATGSVPTCQASQLGYSWADPGSGTGQQKHAVVAFTNKSGHSCTMYGFPGVDLVNSGQKWSLPRTNATPKRVTLANGASTSFPITFLVPAQGESTDFTPTTVVITAPNQRTSYDLPWHGGAVVLQDGATHPGSFIGPVGQ
ncbi:DUF4232 domain-containing protein [Streptomyces sp. NPDC008092]|uniref:DUF4232 domain-containing protein n=1 Tax=Streptomyces sp. NPDC008092 TaxID=3364808 RepID=UPI0036E9D8FB